MTEILTVKETASLLKIQPQTVRRLARNGEIPARKIGKTWRFWRDAIMLWVTTPSNGYKQAGTNSTDAPNLNTGASRSPSAARKRYENRLGL